MTLLRLSGLPVLPPTAAEVRGVDGAWDALVAEAVAFLRVGVVTLTDWAGLTPAERDALTEAAEVVLAERAAVYGMAAQSAEAALGVGARSDGGAGLSGALLHRAVASIAERAHGEPPAAAEPRA